MMTSTQVVEMSVTTTDNSASQDYTYLYNQTTLSHVSQIQIIYCNTKVNFQPNLWIGYSMSQPVHVTVDGNFPRSQ